MRTPRAVDIDITARCNLRCRYCYFFDDDAEAVADLPAADWLRFFEELGRCAVMRVTLAGGEPFMREDLPRLLAGIVAQRMRFAILSNGSLIDDDAAAFIAETGRCDYVQVSVDGSRPETHDACRGRGAFAGALRGLVALKRHGVPVTARVTVNHHNVHDLEATARLLLEELELPSFSTNAASHLGLCRQQPADVQLSVRERQLALASLTALAERYPGRITAKAGPLYEAGRWRKMVAARARNAPRFPDGGYLRGCGCHWSKIAVRPDGTMLPCAMLPQLPLGRINEDPLDQVWRTSPILARLRQRSEIPLTDFSFCEQCEFIPYCTGNCPALAASTIGAVDHPSPDGCLRRFLEQGGQIAAPEAAEVGRAAVAGGGA
jgi:SynChlorMet cassette radical SAM/SPASM protein ScmE